MSFNKELNTLHPFLWRAIRMKFKTQYAFGQFIDRSPAMVSIVVNGEYEISDDEKKRWADALDSTVDELFGDGTHTQRTKQVAMA